MFFKPLGSFKVFTLVPWKAEFPIYILSLHSGKTISSRLLQLTKEECSMVLSFSGKTTYFRCGTAEKHAFIIVSKDFGKMTLSRLQS